MPIVRTSHDKNNPYVQINKHGLEDPLVSWQAKGIWAYLISRPDNWSVSVPHLSSIYNGKGGGEKSIYSIIQELTNHGYCYKNILKNEKGQYVGFEYVITESKNFDTLKNPKKSSQNEHEPFPFEGKMADNTSKAYSHNNCEPFPFEGKMDNNTSTTNNMPHIENQPFPSYRRPAERRPAEVPPTKEGYVIKNEEQQQQNKSVSEKIISIGTSDNRCLPVVFSCLKSIKIPEDQKVIISSTYDEQTVIHAVKYSTRPGFIPNKSLVACIKWACEFKPEIPINRKAEKSSKFEENKKICKNLENEYFSNTYNIIILSKHIEFTPKTTGEVKVLEYSENGFNDQLYSLLNKLNFAKLQVSNA